MSESPCDYLTVHTNRMTSFSKQRKTSVAFFVDKNEFEMKKKNFNNFVEKIQIMFNYFEHEPKYISSKGK